MMLRIYQRQVEMHCRFALFAAQGIQDRLNSQDTEGIWFWVESFLNAVGNLSKVFWPNHDRKDAVDREPLRASLGVTDDSPLQIRKMRNHFEHFDERVEKWWVEDSTHNYVDTSIIPKNAFAGLQDVSFFRLFDPDTLHVTFWSDTYNVPAIVQEVERLLPLASVEAAKPHWQEPT
jgi:hypothetical protein